MTGSPVPMRSITVGVSHPAAVFGVSNSQRDPSVQRHCSMPSAEFRRSGVDLQPARVQGCPDVACLHTRVHQFQGM
jgi:hypothetical protein